MKKLILSCAAAGCAVLCRGEINWHQWQFFHHPDLTRECAAELSGQAAIPEVGGKALEGSPVNITAAGIDLRKELKLPAQALYPAILVKQVVLAQDRLVKLGCGTDWYLEAYCNRKIVYSNFGTGNITYPPSSQDNIIALPLKKGNNIIVLYLQSGVGSFFTALEEQSDGKPAGTISHRVEHESVFPARLELRNGPWLIAPDNGTVTVMFMSQSACGSSVEYRKKGSADWLCQYNIRGGSMSFDRTLHRIVLQELEPGAEYEYRVVLWDDEKIRKSLSLHSFIAPESDNQLSFNFFATGDTQFGVNERGEFLQKYQKYIDKSAFHITLGDLSDTYNDLDLALFGGYFNYLTKENYHNKPFVAVRGNHELRGKERNRWFDLLAPDPEKGYYSFRYGPVMFVVLDTGGDEPFRELNKQTFLYMQKYMKEQHRYLEQLAASREYAEVSYRIILAHAAPHTQKYDALLSATARYLMEPLQKAAKDDPAKRIHLYLTGHVHRYRRSVPGSTQVYACSPVPVECTRSGKEYDFTILSCCGPNQIKEPVSSGTLVKVAADKLLIKSFDENDRCFDHFSIDIQGKVTEYGNKTEILKLYH